LGCAIIPERHDRHVFDDRTLSEERRRQRTVIVMQA